MYVEFKSVEGPDGGVVVYDVKNDDGSYAPIPFRFRHPDEAQKRLVELETQQTLTQTAGATNDMVRELFNHIPATVNKELKRRYV